MDREQLKTKCNLDRIEERTFTDGSFEYKEDYIIDELGNAVIRVSVLEGKLIDKIKELEARILALEAK